jgi:hypothetical protein
MLKITSGNDRAFGFQSLWETAPNTSDTSMKASYARPYFESSVVALVITLLPSRVLAYAAPFICMVWFVVRSCSGKTLYRVVSFFLAFCAALALYTWLYSFNGVRFLAGNAVVAAISYGTVILLLVLPGKGVATEHFDYTRYAVVLKYVILAEGLVGILQFLIVSLTGRFDVLSSDAVQGTIGLTAFVTESEGFGNQMFSINMALFLTLFAPYALTHRNSACVFLIGLLSLVLAGVLHVFIALLVSVVFTVLCYRRNILLSDIQKMFFVTSTAAVLLLSIEFVFPGVSRSANIFLRLYQQGDSPKLQAVRTALHRLPDQYPLVYAIGLGPGQYSSRAGLMSSGEYFGEKLWFMPNEVSQPFKEHVWRMWRTYNRKAASFGNSTMHRPFFSLLSVFAEFGLVGMGLSVGFASFLLVRLRRLFLHYQGRDKVNSHLSFCLAVAILTVIVISFFENYLETTQAILPGLMLAKVFYRQVVDGTGHVQNVVR